MRIRRSPKRRPRPRRSVPGWTARKSPCAGRVMHLRFVPSHGVAGLPQRGRRSLSPGYRRTRIGSNQSRRRRDLLQRKGTIRAWLDTHDVDRRPLCVGHVVRGVQTRVAKAHRLPPPKSPSTQGPGAAECATEARWPNEAPVASAQIDHVAIPPLLGKKLPPLPSFRARQYRGWFG